MSESWRPTDCQWDNPYDLPGDQDDDALPDYERPGLEHWDAEFMSGAHIEFYNGNAARVGGQVRLAPTSEAALLREIKRAGDLGTERLDVPRIPRSPAMRKRLGYPA